MDKAVGNDCGIDFSVDAVVYNRSDETDQPVGSIVKVFDDKTAQQHPLAVVVPTALSAFPLYQPIE